jgi:hypothetical protein
MAAGFSLSPVIPELDWLDTIRAVPVHDSRPWQEAPSHRRSGQSALRRGLDIASLPSAQRDAATRSVNCPRYLATSRGSV